MSYEHLAGRLIETQRSMLGPSAVEIARSTGGIAVDDDGTVTEIEDDKRAAVGTLARRYVDMLGDAAEDRLHSAAREFEDELVLPPALGGPDPSERPAVDRAAPEPVGTDAPGRPVAGAVSDGGTVTVEPASAGDQFADAVDPSAEPATGPEPANATETGTVPEPVTVEYTVASDLDAALADENVLASVYLLPESDDGWQAPVSVERAVVDLVSETTTLHEAAVDSLVAAIDPARLVATFDGEAGETVSFVHGGITVTFHRSGSLAVH
jgi:hypothetical protein